MTMHVADPAASIPPLPRWVEHGQAGLPEAATFQSGAVLAHLHAIIVHAVVPQELWRARLALQAAESCVRIAGRHETATALRDAVHLVRPGDQAGPAGDVLLCWTMAVQRPVTAGHLARALPQHAATAIGSWLDAGAVGRGGTPVDHAARVMRAVLADQPRAETAALLLADAALAIALGWSHVLPLLGTGLKPRDLRLPDGELQPACHRAIIAAARAAVASAADLARRAARLRAVAPALRAKGADRAVSLFLSQDAVSPAALGPVMSDRAARRLCERLVALGAVRELTGRDSFRLYGV